MFILTFIAIVMVIVLAIIAKIVFRENKELIPLAFYPNSGYIPIPIALNIWSIEGVALVGFYVMGSNSASNLIYPIIFSGKLKSGLRRLLFFPPLYGIVCALILIFTNFMLPEYILTPLKDMGKTAAPLALIVLGIDASKSFKINIHTIKLIVLRSVLSPFLMVILTSLLNISGTSLQIAFLESLMPPAVSNIILANEFGTDTEKVANNVVLSTLFCTFIVIPLFLFLILPML